MRRSIATIATPCPVAPSQSRILDETYTEDTTTNLDYTTAFHASFRNVRPKRRQLTRGSTLDFTIHEDAEVGNGLNVGEAKEQPPKLLRPAKRVAVHTGVPAVQERGANFPSKATSVFRASNSEASPPQVSARRISKGISIHSGARVQEQEISPRNLKPAGVKQARRKTLYIPSDDTTQPTMWMGIFSPIKNEIDQNQDNCENGALELTGIAAQMADKRRRRVSTIHPKAKRIPLQHNATAQGQAGEILDRAGAPTGKENLPPGSKRNSQHIKQPYFITGHESKEKVKIDRDAERKRFLAQARSDMVAKSSSGPEPRSPVFRTMYEIGQQDQKTNLEKAKRVAWNAGPRYVTKEECDTKQKQIAKQVQCDIGKSTQSLPTVVPTRFVQRPLHEVPECPPHAPLIEHIEHPEMYEDDWLGHQEIVITQLLNSVLSEALIKDCQTTSSDEIRSILLDRYNKEDIRLIYNRVQSATLYGTLSLTQEAMFQITNLGNDLGRRKAFLKFWIDNYDTDLLKSALEVVSGRQMTTATKRRSNGSLPVDSTKRQNIAAFIESFILKCEDSQFKAAGSGASTDLGNKAIIRSLMLVKALDLLKEDSLPIVGSCLFRKNAIIKSSVVAVQTLMQMLNPSVGDPVRALRQLGYTVSHQQEPIDELECQIENIAVDLRDGICLTRVVEILLYRSKLPRHDTVVERDVDTITMSDGQTIALSNQESYPLSRHLKIPCASRAAKLWNVQIALGALQNVKNIESLISDIQPDDIVDGYREKTIKLLWTIVGRWGLASFIDKDDLKREIKRLGGGVVLGDDTDGDSATDDARLDSETLVKRWTEAVAGSRGVEVSNYTTSFSDGRIFEAILDEYQPHLASGPVTTAPLHERLLNMGCSRQFSNLFAGKDGQVHIFGKDFVLAALAFLCSRVVGPSKVCRSAVQIQRCWRMYWEKVYRERLGIKRDLAHACAASACLKQEQTSGCTGPTRADARNKGDLTPAGDAKTEIDEDIWLSL